MKQIERFILKCWHNIKSSAADPDPVGSVYNWLFWIRIRLSYMDPDPAALKIIAISNFF